MAPRGSRFRGLALHAAHEQAKRERAAKERDEPSYELRSHRRARRRETRGWAEDVVTRWLEELRAVDIVLDRDGSDLLCSASSPIGDVSVTMLTPYQTGYEVSAICEPWLVRAEIGDQESPASAWVVETDVKDCVLISSASSAWCGVVMMPRLYTGLFRFLHGSVFGLFRYQVRAALDRVATLAASRDEALKEALWSLSSESALKLGVGRKTLIGRRVPSLRRQTEEMASVASGLRACGVFETVTASRGTPSRWAAAAVVERPERDVEPAQIVYDGRVHAASKAWGVKLDADVFRVAFPVAAVPSSLLAPSSWAVAKLSLDEHPRFESIRLTEIPGLVGACFWIDGEGLLSGGFSKRVEHLVAEALSGHHGPYR